MAKLSDVQKVELKKIFDAYDTDKNGEITPDELKDAFKKMDFPMSDLQIANLIGKADADGSGTIDFDEFCAHNEVAASKEIFGKYDKNGDGFLGPTEVIAMAKDLGYGNVTMHQAQWLITLVDKNGDGRISFDEFKSLSMAL